MSFEKFKISEIPNTKESTEKNFDTTDMRDLRSVDEMQSIYDKVFDKYDLVDNKNNSDDLDEARIKPDKKAYDMTDDELFNELGLDKDSIDKIKDENGTENDDGTYTDETGKTYDSFADWLRAQYTRAKRLYSTSETCKAKADKEWARYKNAESNGESDAQKWKHYQTSQQYYEHARNMKEAADSIMDNITHK